MKHQRTLWGQRQKWHPLGLSLVVHSLFTCLLILWFFSGSRQLTTEKLRRGEIVVAVNFAVDPTEYLKESEANEALTDPIAPPSPAASPINSDSAPEIPLPRSQPELNSLLTGVPPHELALDAAAMTSVPQSTGLQTEYQLSAEDLKLIEADQRLIKSRQPVGEPTTISVFGSGNLTGRDFVFVLDRSKSMGNGGLGVIAASRHELSRAIGKLEPHHRFQIVGYHDRTVTMSNRHLLPASEENQRMVADFIGNLVAYGGTQHENGLIAAIAFRPDVIVLLTDGGYPELNAGQLKLIQRMVGTTTEIHCLQFGSGPQQQPKNFMTQLASQNRGHYQYIDVNQWTKKK